jgi:hypothetical protein
MWTNRLFSTRFFRPAVALSTVLLLLFIEMSVHAVPVVAAGECTVGQGYATIQAAVDDAQCTSISVPAGNYAEIVVVDRDLSIVGAGAELTVVDGQGAGSVFFITEDATVLLSGLTITGGTGSAAGDDQSAGGGIANLGTLTVTDSVIRANQADWGGGIHNYEGNLTVIGSTISDNNGTWGGGLSNYKGEILVRRSMIIGNSATEIGGGIYSATEHKQTGVAAVEQSTIHANSAENGAGIYSSFDALLVNQSTISANQATVAGGGIYSEYGSVLVRSSTLSGNEALQGGGIFSLIAKQVILFRSTLSDNRAEEGGGLSNQASMFLLTNTIVAHSTGGDCGGEGPMFDGGDNFIEDDSCSELDALTGDPLLGPLADNGGPTQTHALLPGSPAIDAIPVGNEGCNDVVTADQNNKRIFTAPGGITRSSNDQRGKARPYGDGCDIGAYEHQADTGAAEDPATLAGDNEARENPVTLPSQASIECTVGQGYASIQSAVDDAQCSPIQVPAGSYAEAVVIDRDLSIVGAGADVTVVDARGVGSVFFIVQGVKVSLSGLTITGGSGSELFADGRILGGGIANGGTLSLTDSVIRDNSANTGGGIYTYYGDLTVVNSTISENKADAGGGICAYYGKMTVSNSVINDNEASLHAGALYNEGARVLVEWTTMHANHAGMLGGAILDLRGRLIVDRSTISANHAGMSGGAIDSEGDKVLFRNSTLSGNTAPEGGAIYSYRSEIDLIQSTITGNESGEGGAIYSRVSTFKLSGTVIGNNQGDECAFLYRGEMIDGGYNLIEDDSCGDWAYVMGNPMLGPLADNGGPTQTHALLPDSPAIDVIPTGVDGCGEPNSLDQRGLARLQGAGCDIGAYEVQDESSTVEDLTPTVIGSGEGEGGRASFVWILIRAALVVFLGKVS